MMKLIFVFQAEDGIRDGHVTGVQTCALPISAADPDRAGEQPGIDVVGLALTGVVVLALMYPFVAATEGEDARSEERRVGKECGWRGGRQVSKSNSNGAFTIDNMLKAEYNHES